MSESHERRALSHTIEIAAPPDAVFPMLTPEGERAWVSGWDPRFVPPSSGPSQVGSVFWTDHDGEDTLWMVVDLDAEVHRARYVRHTPGSRIGLVEVVCEPCAAGTRVTVSYDITGLSVVGSESVLAFEQSFVEAIDGWKQLIETALGGEPARQ